eukprot:12512940-Alexandrium_andersonii.AAC.1
MAERAVGAPASRKMSPSSAAQRPLSVRSAPSRSFCAPAARRSRARVVGHSVSGLPVEGCAMSGTGTAGAELRRRRRISARRASATRFPIR